MRNRLRFRAAIILASALLLVLPAAAGCTSSVPAPPPGEDGAPGAGTAGPPPPEPTSGLASAAGTDSDPQAAAGLTWEWRPGSWRLGPAPEESLLAVSPGGGWVAAVAGHVMGLDGLTLQVRPAANRRLLAAGVGWAVERDLDRMMNELTVWQPPAPPLPPGPTTGYYLALPDGNLAVADPTGQIWMCRPGAPACRQLDGLGDDSPLSWSRPWLVQRWQETPGYFIGGVRLP